MSLTDLGLNRTRLTLLVMVLILLAGLGNYVGFPKREDPEITVRTALVMARNEGLSLDQVEELVARPLEENARSIGGVDEVRSLVRPGFALIEIDIATDVPESALDRVFGEIEDDMDDLARDMPEGTTGPVVNTDFGDVAIATVAVTAEGFSLPETERFAEALRDRVYGLDAVSAVTLHGVQDERVWLEVDRSRVASIGTTLDPVVEALTSQNVVLPSGSFTTDGLRVPLSTTGDFADLDAIRDTLVDIPDVGLLRLGDLVEVRRGTVEPADRPVFQDGRPAILLSIEMDAGEDVVAAGAELRALVDGFVADQPWGVEATFSTFQPKVVEDSVNNALANMGQTFVVVLLVMLAFLGLRQALVIAAIVPLAVGFSFTMMPFLGVELQQVSIAAIIISLGLLVDNGVVVIEDMDRRIRHGADRRSAAREAGRQFTGPLAIASVTTVAAFLPLFLLDGTEGQYGYSLGAVVALMLTGSFLASVYILPVLAVWLLPDPKPGQRHGPFARLATGYGRLVAFGLRAPLLMVLACLAVVGASLSQVGDVRQQLFPLSERAQFLVYMDLPRGSDISETQDTALDFAAWLGDDARNPEVTGTTVFVGFGGPRFVLSLDPAEVDPASAFFVVNTTSFEASEQVVARATSYLRREVPEARTRLKRLAMGGREPGIEIEVTGPDADRLLAAGTRIEEALSALPGMVENQGDWGTRMVRGKVVVAQDRARQYGLTSRTVSDALDGFLDGRPVSTLRQGDDQIPIVLRGQAGSSDSFGDLMNVVIATPNGPVSLDQVARFEPELVFSAIRRVDQQRRLTVKAQSSRLSAYELADAIGPTLDTLAAELGEAYSFNIGGEVEQSAEVREKLGGGFPAAVTVMLLALMTQFNSIRRVGITLLCIPLVVAGAPLALTTFDQPMSFFGMLGLIALTGVIINNAIVLIDQIDIERQTRPLDEAIAEAARKRFRPILLTSLTTVLGLVPMAMTGGALWEPMATLMIGGLGLASVLTLFYVPGLYRLVFRKAGAAG